MWWFALPALAQPQLAGEWKLAEPADALSAKHAEAVEAGVSQLTWLIRPIGRSKLQSAVVNCARMSFALSDAAFEVGCDGHPRTVVPRAPGKHPWTNDKGETMQLELAVHADRVELVFHAEAGGQRSVYAVGDDGRLVVTKTLLSSHFTSPVSWSAGYAR